MTIRCKHMVITGAVLLTLIFDIIGVINENVDVNNMYDIVADARYL